MGTTEETTAGTASDVSSTTDSGTNLKEELSGDKEAIKEQRQTIKENAGAARDEEKALRDQLHQAVQAKDFETAKKLREQLKTTHQENAGQRDQDKAALKDSRQDLKQDRKAVRQSSPPAAAGRGGSELRKDRLEKRKEIRGNRSSSGGSN
jgi:hypothetical protein